MTTKNPEPDFSDLLCPICKMNPAVINYCWQFDQNHNYGHDGDYGFDDYFDDDPPANKIYFPGPCQTCQEAKQKKRIERDQRCQIKKIPSIITEYGVYPIHRRASLADFPESIVKKTKERNSFYIHGKTGAGKTHLAAALICENLLKKEKDILMITATSLLLQIKNTFNTGSEMTEQELINQYSTITNLYLDDIGAEKITDWSVSILYLIIDRRYGNEMKTVFTSNLNLNDLVEKLGDRIVSRIAGMCDIIHLSGNDRRLSEF